MGKFGPLTFNTNHILLGGLFVLSAVCLWRGRLKVKMPETNV
jgi:hypothetical protein